MFGLSDLGFGRGYSGFASTSGPDQSPWIGPLELCRCTIVCCIIVVCIVFILSALGLASGDFGFAMTSSPDQSFSIGSLGISRYVIVPLYYRTMRTVCAI